MVKILLVEDEPLARKCTAMFLELKGHEIYEAADGIEALELFACNEFALLVSDIKMPRMDGTRLIEEIRTLSPRLPIIVTTAFSDRAPGDGIPTLSKPINLEHLSQAIDELLIDT